MLIARDDIVCLALRCACEYFVIRWVIVHGLHVKLASGHCSGEGQRVNKKMYLLLAPPVALSYVRVKKDSA